MHSYNYPYIHSSRHHASKKKIWLISWFSNMKIVLFFFVVILFISLTLFNLQNKNTFLVTSDYKD